MKVIKKVGGADVDVLLISGILLTIALIVDVWLACAFDRQWGAAFFVQGVIFFFGAGACLFARFVDPI